MATYCTNPLNKMIWSFLTPTFLVFSMASTIAFAKPTAESIELAKTIRIADVHMHTVKGFDANWLLERMNRNGVYWGGAVGGLISEDPLKFKEAMGNRYIAALGQGEFTEVLATRGEKALLDVTDQMFVDLFDKAKKALSEGIAKGFGEIHVSNKGAYGAPSNFQRQISLKSPVVTKMFELANEYQGFVQIHATKPVNFSEIKDVARTYPKVNIIISHCLPFGTANDMRELFKEHKNVFCEISGAGPFHKNQRMYSSRGPKDEYVSLIEEFPDRVMVGSDAFFGVHMGYDQIIKEIRESFLPHFKPATIRKLAYENAQKIFDLKD